MVDGDIDCQRMNGGFATTESRWELLTFSFRSASLTGRATAREGVEGAVDSAMAQLTRTWRLRIGLA